MRSIQLSNRWPNEVNSKRKHSIFSGYFIFCIIPKVQFFTAYLPLVTKTWSNRILFFNHNLNEEDENKYNQNDIYWTLEFPVTMWDMMDAPVLNCTLYKFPSDDKSRNIYNSRSSMEWILHNRERSYHRTYSARFLEYLRVAKSQRKFNTFDDDNIANYSLT